MRRIIAGLLTLLIVAVTVLADAPGHAASYPERLIKLVVPFPAGGPTDVAARLIAQAMSSRLGQPVVVENLVGAGGRIGAKSVADAAPDGYTLLLGGTNVNAIIGALYKDIGFDPIASFAPVAAVCTDTMALAISPRLPPQTFDQFVQFARERPGKLTYGATSGIYTQFAADFFKAKTGTDILFVPYKGGAPAITDLLGGHIDMVFNNKSTLLTHFKAGKLRPLVVTSKTRWPELPDIPTMQELGVAGFPTEVWFGVLAPAGTPPAIVGTLNAAINEGLKSSEVQASLAELGLEAKVGSPQDLAAALGEQARDWKTVIDTIGFKAE
jgi:tripartite-type tricarboxylate transporter receptor subunit TctC